MIDTKALRSHILDLAIRGKLTEQLESDGTAEELYQQIQAEKQALIKEGKIKKEKLLPPIKPDEIPFEIPSNWKWVRLQAIANSIWAGRDKPDDFVPVKDEFRTIPVVANGVTDEGILGYTATATAPKNSITVAGRGTIGFSVHRIYDYCPIIRLIVIEQSSFIEPQYLQLIMVKFPESSVGSSIPQLTVPMIKPKIIPLPPLAEQKRIVERVEEIFRLLDTIDQAQEKYSADAESLKAKLITAGIQGKLTEQLESDGTAEELYQQIQAEKQKLIKEGKIKKEKPLPAIKDEEIPFEIPGNWKWVRLSELTGKITSGSTPAGGKKGNAYVNEGYCFFREQNIYNDGIHTDGMVYISEELLKTRENSTVLPNDILLNITGGSIGRCAIIPDDFSKGSINQHILIIRLVEKEMLNYIHDLLCSPYYQGIIQSKVVGDKDGFSGGRCKATLIPLPPLAEQKRIAEVLERVLGALSLQ